MLDNVSKADEERIQYIMDAHDYEDLRDTQVQAFEEGVLNPGNHLLVANTGNGKTLCAESLVKKRLDNGKTVAYLVPSNQLVRDKKRAIKEWVDDDVLVTSGRGKYSSGDVVVATFNSFYQAILRGTGRVRGIDLVVLDDFHELYGSFIGPGLEKTIAAAKYENMELFAMSATIGNHMEIADWLDATLTISEEKRAIPIIENCVSIGRQSKKEGIAEFVSNNADRSPFLIFNYAKSWTESRASEIAKTGAFDDLSDSDISFDEEMRKRVDGTLPERLQDLAEQMSRGVAFHHSNLPRNIKTWIEELYMDGKIGCICATTTIAYGFDSPVQSVIVADMKRMGQWVGKWEYQQWIGRAARPGYDYDRGYAYVISDEKETVRDEFFKPRELEPITSHVDSPPEFRRFILELIEMGWDTPQVIEEFIEGTLFWNQMNEGGAWGRDFSNKERRIKSKLRETADWLESRSFIRESRTQNKFESTKLGSAAVNFIFNASRTPTLQQIYRFYSSVSAESELNRLSLLGKVTDIFDISINSRSASADIEQEIVDCGMSVTKESITAAVLHLHWIKNRSVARIEQKSNVDAAYISTIAYRVASMLKASKPVIDVSTTPIPNWFDRYSYRVERGVRLEEKPYVENVTGLGRSRVRSLRSYAYSSIITPDDASGSLSERLDMLCEDIDDEQEQLEKIAENVDGIGQKLSERLLEFHRETSISDVFKKESHNSRKTLDDY